MSEGEKSDYFGKPIKEEMKKSLLSDERQQTIHATSAVSSPKNSGDHNESLKILQAHSQPNLLPKTDSFNPVLSELSSPRWNISLAADDSFIKMENMVAKLSVSPRNKEKPEELNNTLDIIQYILKNPPSSSKEKNDGVRLMTENEPNLSDISQQKIDKEVKEYEAYNSSEPPQNIPAKTTHQLHKYIEGHTDTTPQDIKQKPTLKTPVQPLLLKKPSSFIKTPSRSNAYQHISSPVASYIKNSPITPLFNVVTPKKPLPGTSYISKFVKNLSPAIPSNKEYVNLPSVAYKSAKKTRVIEVSDEQKLPQSHWVKKITKTSPRPLVLTHDHREFNIATKKKEEEDSFADLSYQQAEVSVCIQKSAIKTKKNH